MKCINKKGIRFSCILLAGLILTGCSQKIIMPYTMNSGISAFNLDFENTLTTADAFAADLCIASGDVNGEITADMSKVTSAGLFDITGYNTVYAKNMHKVLNPASLTKVMTALMVLKYNEQGKITMEDVLTASSNVVVNESGAQLCGIKQGDTMTMTQALNCLLVNSANDAAILISEHISESVEEFVVLMNEEAKKLGATNTNFTNPHGLTDDLHTTTAYDLYLIFNEAVKYELFNEIISMTSYTTTYKDSAGNPKELTVGATNLYFTGDYNAPGNVTVIGGKTGATNAAGACLVLLSKNTSGKPYISIILQAENKDVLYADMTKLLSGIDN